jgi:hypothetical protein
MSALVKFLLETPEGVVLILLLVVPGFVYTKFYDALAPGEREDIGQVAIDILGWSFLLLLLWYWPFAALYEARDSLGTWLRYLLVFLLTVVAVFLTPLGAAYLMYRIRHRDLLKRVTGGEASHPAPTAWDWFFSERADNYYVRLHLKSGEKVGGYYGENSFATSFPHEQEVYLEEAWRLDEDGNFTEQIEGTKGTLVRKDDYTLLEIFEVLEASGDQEDHKSIAEVAEESKPIELMHGEGYQSGRPNSPRRTPPGREHY